MGYYAKALAGFIALDLLLNLGIAQSSSFGLQVLLVLLFFPLLKGILVLTKVKEFKAIGIGFHPRWLNNAMLGFAIGFSFWFLQYALKYASNGYDIVGMQSFSDSVLSLLMILLTTLVGSFLNDVIVRGYVFGHLKDRLPLKGGFLISIVIYALDDIWNEGFDLGNTLFSLALGLSLTYAIYRTGSIWATTGIHWGLNVCYGLFNGSLGQSGGGIVLTEWNSANLLTESISYLVPLTMFVFILFTRRRFAKA